MTGVHVHQKCSVVYWALHNVTYKNKVLNITSFLFIKASERGRNVEIFIILIV